MGFTVKGNFTGHLCRNYSEPLSNVQVKIYQRAAESASDVKSESDLGQSLQVLDKKQIVEKEIYFIGEGRTDALGNYEIVLSEQYDGGLIEIDLKITEIPHQKVEVDKSVQFTARKLRPVFRDEDGTLGYSWNYCFSFQFWSSIRKLFDAWVICGYVKSVKDRKTPLEGVRVSAYDVDWIKDDYLGTGVTNEKGFFRIDYHSSDFKHTFLSPVINLETPFSAIPGPGVYFKVISKTDQLLYKEDNIVGQTGERKNIAHCFCIDLYVDCSRGN